jgi:hypothetical protein
MYKHVDILLNGDTMSLSLISIQLVLAISRSKRWNQNVIMASQMSFDC